jgi:hypothetical protein
MADWFPEKRSGVIHMADIWIVQLDADGILWGVPPGKMTKLKQMTAAAKTLLAELTSGNRSQASTERCHAVFIELETLMRSIKDTYFNSPPRTSDELAALLLSSPDDLPDIIPRSDVAPGLSLHNSNDHEVLCRFFMDAVPADHRSVDHFFVKWGVKPVDRWATGEEAGADGRLLTRPPIRARDLPEHFSTGRKTHILTFGPADVGMELFATACWQTPRNEDGPYCPIVSKLIS